ncbi:TonB-dependent receptor plug domain-containing protein [Pelagicoccus mobilis]|uniref:TonB-dependent receptor plug domain-containing protein n=1 Tax=Pelagicoccus mobilis TaxID=415221 RepID=A0A934RYW0_9BACT|nr:TonB-dependent receptor plug domain-containing protein [Pelagicoccus mobilis]MBK1876048.1 TonB-dependent receptor plug domain-containing protein [Pelagicoccus mobilis]
MKKDKLPTLARGGATLMLCGAFPLFCSPFLSAQDADEDEEIFELSPFTIDGSEDEGYRATSTLAGSRLRTDLKDVGSAISVVTKELLEDLGAVDNETLLSYTTSTEVGGAESIFTGTGNGTAINERGNFTSPNSNTRVRGLARADNTRDYFLTDVSWDNYVVDRVDMQRGPNAILFGLGSPAGIVNATTHEATFTDSNKAELRFGSYGSARMMLRSNRVILEDELAIKFALLGDRQKFRQNPAFDNDERFFLAAKYVPSFLKGDSTDFSIKANFERGSIESNRPRTLTPQDNITPFFRSVKDSDGEFNQLGGIGGRLFDPFDVRNANKGVGYGQTQPVITVDGDEVPNPDYIPGLGNFSGAQGPAWIWDSAGATSPYAVRTLGVNRRGGIGPDGTLDGGLGIDFGNYVTIEDYDDYAVSAELPASELGQYKRRHLQDRTVFDFFNNLIDGPNKQEWSDWDVFNARISHTFLNGSLGYELSFFDQEYSAGRTGILGWNDSIYVDLNSTLMDGSPNPNAGRPYVGDVMIGANNITTRDRDAARATAYFKHDFLANNEGWVSRLLGKHIFTGLASESSQEVDNRTFHRYRMDPTWVDYQTKGKGVADLDLQNSHNLVSTIHYIGDSLVGKSSASGLNLSAIQAVQLPSTAPIYTFDSQWNAPGIDPAADWIDPRTGNTSTQSENPANYVGWTFRDHVLTDSLNDPIAMANNTSNGNLSRNEITSEALIWQGYFWDGAIVGTYGWREDELKTWNKTAPTNKFAPESNPNLNTKIANVDPDIYNLDFDPNEEGGQSHSYSVAGHLNELLGSPDWMPLNVSLYYNESENFQPGAGRNDMFGLPIAAPSGSTRDKSILVSTKDNNYSLKVTRYKTTVNDASSAYLANTWIMGNIVALGETWSNVFNYNLKRNHWNKSDVVTNGAHPWYYNMKNPDGVFDQEYEDLVVADWRAFRDELITTFPTFADAWNLTGLGQGGENIRFTQKNPTGLNFTEDATSIGTEYEFTARPTESLRLTMNASKIEAFRNNVGGQQVIQFVEMVDHWLATSEIGNLRLYGGGGKNNIRKQWNKFRAPYSLTKLLEGTASPELRTWHFNAVGRYEFKDGRFKGLALGGGVRWADDVILGYDLTEDENGDPVYHLANPHVGPDDTKVDFMASYSTKIGNGVKWRIQLNVRDLLADKDLIPLSTQPDGSYAAVRIPGSTTWQLTNSFDF